MRGPSGVPMAGAYVRSKFTPTSMLRDSIRLSMQTCELSMTALHTVISSEVFWRFSTLSHGYDGHPSTSSLPPMVQPYLPQVEIVLRLKTREEGNIRCGALHRHDTPRQSAHLSRGCRGSQCGGGTSLLRRRYSRSSSRDFNPWRR